MSKSFFESFGIILKENIPDIPIINKYDMFINENFYIVVPLIAYGRVRTVDAMSFGSGVQ